MRREMRNKILKVIHNIMVGVFFFFSIEHLGWTLKSNIYRRIKLKNLLVSEIISKVGKADKEGKLGIYGARVLEGIRRWFAPEVEKFWEEAKNIEDSLEWHDKVDYFYWKEIKELVDEAEKTGDWSEIIERFYTNLEFGTAGIRGKEGAGLNRINPFTVAMNVLGFAKSLKSDTKEMERYHLITYDNRENSKRYALLSASIFVSEGLKVLFTDDYRTVGWFAFVLTDKYLKGESLGKSLIITASHNPKEYNGFKISDSYGGQILPDAVSVISEEAKKVKFDELKLIDLKEAIKKGLVKIMGQNEDEIYIKDIKDKTKDERLTEQEREKVSQNVHFLIDTLYGATNKLVVKLFSERNNVHFVEKHRIDDPNFGGLSAPNPTAKGVLDHLLEEASSLTNRLNPSLNVRKEDYITLSGNESWELFLYYILSKMKEEGEIIPGVTKIYMSHVSSSRIKNIANYFGVVVEELPVGHKWIGFAMDRNKNGIFGFEESNGASQNTHAREKDALLFAAYFMEMISYWYAKSGRNDKLVIGFGIDSDGDRITLSYNEKDGGKFIREKLEEIGQKFGYTKNIMHPLLFEGVKGMEQKNKVYLALQRLKAGDKIAGKKIVSVKIKENWNIEGVDIVKEDGIEIKLETGDRIIIRQSGTEPALRIYTEAKNKRSEEEALEVSNYLYFAIKELIEKLARP